MLFQKTFNSSWTVLCFCALSTGWFGGTPGNIKLINFTKRTGRQTTKTGRQTGVQQAGWQLITAMMRGENCRCHNQKNMAASTLLQVMHNHPHTHTRTHPSTHTHTALIHLPKTCTLLFFKFFLPSSPPSIITISCQSRRRLADSIWRARTRRMTVRAGQLMSQDGGRTTVGVPWLVEADGHRVPEQADWVVWSQEVRFSVSLQWADWLFRVSTGRWREVSWHASGLGRSSRWAWALESAGSSSGRSRWLPSHPDTWTTA